MKKQDTSEDQAKIVYLALGSNLGDKIQNMNMAKFRLENNRIKILKCSSYYESLSWPNPRKPKFINIVLKVKTTFSVQKLLKICQSIEIELGRLKKKKNDPRTCDIDIIDYDNKVLKTSGKNYLHIPHPELNKRNFVLLPLFEISKSWSHPQTKLSISKLISLLKIDDLRAIKQI